MRFFNRDNELERLRKGFSSEDPVLMVLYGRRRCGKSTLLQKMMGPCVIYYLATQEDAQIQRDRFATEVAGIIPRFDAVVYPSWAVLFDALNDRVDGEILRVVLDEFPYLVQTSPELPSILQRYWDRPGEKRITLALCGSSQRMMQGVVLDRSAPLYGRAREIMRIAPLRAGWIGDALNLPPSEAIEAFSIWGGVPRYWELAAPYASTSEAIRNILLDRHGILFDEPTRLLLDEMRGTVQAFSLLTLIGRGCHRLSEIAGRLGKPAGNLARPLAQLVELGYVKREYPFGESARSTKRTLYKLEDPFLQFYFRFIEPNRSRIECGAGGQLAEEIAAALPSHVSWTWEELARESVVSSTIGGQEWTPASRWWGAVRHGPAMEIDVVAESVDGTSLLLGEVKWGGSSQDVDRLHHTLQQKAARFEKTTGKQVVTAVWLGNRDDACERDDVMDEQTVLDSLRN